MKKFLSLILAVVMIFSVPTTTLMVNAASSNTVKTSISKIESKAKGFKVTYKKKSKIKGYQIQYSTSSKFKGSSTKIKTITNYKTTSATISKLKGCNVKYYVRVRTYKVSKGEKIYSSWSKAKTVTTLKHKYSKATCTKAKTCKYCKKTSGKKLGHKYTNVCDTKCNVCKAKRTAPHKYTNACDSTCNICKAKRKAPHKYTNACDTKCNSCKATRTIKHSYKAATCTKPKTCSVCKKTSGKALGHSYSKGICKRCKKYNYADVETDIAGYYWYLDGYEYTYLHPTIIPWYDHQLLQWESKNIQIYKNKLTAYENYKYDAYSNIDVKAESNTHNTLLVNPLEFSDDLVRDYKMRVSENKLYMVVGGKEYSFTRRTTKKTVNIILKLEFEQVTAKVGEYIFLPVEISPFWEYHQIEVVEDASDDFSIAYHDRWYTSGDYPFGSGGDSSDGETTLIFYAQSVGERTLNIRVKGTKKTYQLKITVLPEKVTSVTLDKSDISLYKGESETVTATVLPSNASNKDVTWSSSDPSIATVSSSGKIIAKKHGTATITVTTKDGGYTATCTVVVKQKPLKVSASIGISTRYTSNSIQRGISVTVQATDGSENYEEYSIKLYRNGTYIGEVSSKEMFVTPLVNGTYTAEVYVKDSSGNEATAIQTTTISY